MVPSVLEQEEPIWIDRLRAVFMADAKRSELDSARARAQEEIRKRHGPKS